MTSGIICLPRHLRGDALTAWMLRKPSSAPTFRIRTKIILVGLIHAFQRAEGNTSSVHSVSLHSHSSEFGHSLSLSLSLLALVLLLLSSTFYSGNNNLNFITSLKHQQQQQNFVPAVSLVIFIRPMTMFSINRIAEYTANCGPAYCFHHPPSPCE